MARKVPSHSEKLDNVVIETDKGKEFTVAEIKHSDRIVKSATPKGDLSWWIKWFSSIIVLAAIAIRASGVQELQIVDVFLSWLGAVGWLWVGFLWKDRALVLLNGMISIMLLGGLIRYLFNSGVL